MEDKEVLGKISEKLSKTTFWTVIGITLAIIVGSIANLYTLYFSGIVALKEDMATVKTQIEYMQEDIGEINNKLKISIVEYDD